MQEVIYDVRNITYSYPSDGRKVLRDASLRLCKGDILCILGPNGAGKTTLLNCMAGLLNPSSGEIMLCGRKMNSLKPKEAAALVGYVPQTHTPAFDYSVLDFVMMGRAPKTGTFSRPGKEDEGFCIDILNSMGIGSLADKSYLNISGGERQQVLIARAIAQEPQVILFDEPTSHLDFGNQHRVLKRIKTMAEEGFSIVITTHNPDHALMLGSQAAIVEREGSIHQGTVDEIITEDNLRKAYDIELELKFIEELGRKACFAPKL